MVRLTRKFTLYQSNTIRHDAKKHVQSTAISITLNGHVQHVLSTNQLQKLNV